jgi:glycosyltransferase involved in cell wall biosynthesis
MTLGRIQFILDLHGPFIEELKHYELVTNQYLLSLLSLGERAVYMSAAHIFVTSTGLSKIVTTKVDSNKVNVLYDYVSLEMFSPQKSTVLESYGVKNNFVIMYVGMLKDYQGVDYLIDAFAEVNTEELEFNLQLVIVGNSNVGYYRDIAADQGIENKVTFTGLQPHSEIPQFMAAADILVAPRIDTDVTQGGFLSQLPEYLAMQKPIIATDVSDSKKVLDDGKYGLLVPDSDTTALANAISQLAQDDELRQTIAEGTRERAERYSWQHGYKKIERKVESIVNTNQGESQ